MYLMSLTYSLKNGYNGKFMLCLSCYRFFKSSSLKDDYETDKEEGHEETSRQGTIYTILHIDTFQFRG